MQKVVNPLDAWKLSHRATDSIDLFGRVQFSAERHHPIYNIDVDSALRYPRCTEGFALDFVFEVGVREARCNLSVGSFTSDALSSTGDLRANPPTRPSSTALELRCPTGESVLHPRASGSSKIRIGEIRDYRTEQQPENERFDSHFGPSNHAPSSPVLPTWDDTKRLRVRVVSVQLAADWHGVELDISSSGGLAPHTLKDYRREVVQFFGHAGIPWDRVTLTELTAYSASIAPSRTRIAYAALRNFWRWMRASGYEVTDPGFELMPYHKQTKKVPSAFTKDEVKRLVEAARSLSPKTEGILVLFYTTGVRARELEGVLPTDVTLDGLVVRVPKRKPGDQAKERIVPLTPDGRRAVELLLTNRRPRDRATLIGIGYEAAWRRVKEAGLWAGVDDVHPHKFRATAATHMLRSGIDIKTVAAVLGHSSIATTYRYLATDSASAKAAVATLNL
jgi:integrase/recombinase XerD